MRFIILLICFSFAFNVVVNAQNMTASALKAIGAPNNPKVEIAWNRYYDSEQIGDICQRLAAAHPGLIKYSSIGESVQGNPLHLLTVSDFVSGDADRKPAMYVDGNIHSNEIQGAEVALYTAWYLAESQGQNSWIAELLKERTFYIIPTINPDARDYYIREGNTPHSPRSGLLPRDDDGDGLVDEDPLDDLDNDGNIVMMRRKNPHGRWKSDTKDSRRMVEADADEPGEFDFIGWEGIDNDGDGRINEDGPGYYDPNRNWAWNWQPSHVQHGADQYPFSIPENRAVADFVVAHPNIAGAQSYHNSGGMILRGPGVEADSSYDEADMSVYDNLGKTGEEMLPGYRYLVLYKDLYSTYGGELDWFYGGRGIYTFTNELWTSFNYFRKKEEKPSWFGRQQDVYRFDELLLFGEGIVDWKPIKHPQFGDIEIGGIKKSWTRTAPSFMIEDMCHRNMAFTLFHAYHLPRVSIDSVSVVKQKGLYKIDVTVINERMVPTRSSHEVKHKFTRPDILRLEGAKVIAGMLIVDPLMDISKEQKYRPERINVDAIPAMGSVHVRWWTRKKPDRIIFDSIKGGVVSFSVP
jgi:hypothetical protein